eukprot:1152543-Rhodomonas_salina.2
MASVPPLPASSNGCFASIYGGRSAEGCSDRPREPAAGRQLRAGAARPTQMQSSTLPVHVRARGTGGVGTQGMRCGFPVLTEAIRYGSPVLTHAVRYASSVLTQAIRYGSSVLTQGMPYGSPVLTEAIRSGSPVLTEAIRYGSPVLTEAIRYGSPVLTEVPGTDKGNALRKSGSVLSTEIRYCIPHTSPVVTWGMRNQLQHISVIELCKHGQEEH